MRELSEYLDKIPLTIVHLPKVRKTRNLWSAFLVQAEEKEGGEEEKEKKEEEKEKKKEGGGLWSIHIISVSPPPKT